MDPSEDERQEPTIIATSRPFLHGTSRLPAPETVRAVATRLWDACRTLTLPMNSYTTALLYFQRFLALSETTEDTDTFVLATACLVAALKTEGSPKKLESLDQAMRITATSRTSELERQVMETNAFDFRLVHAHPYVVKISKSLQLDEEHARRAWSVTTDAYETPAVLHYPAHTIALGSICVMSRLKGERLLVKDTRLLGSRADAVRGVMRTLLQFYTDCTSAGLETHAGLSMRSEDFNEWLAQNAAASARHEPTPVLNGHEISTNGVARYRLKLP